MWQVIYTILQKNGGTDTKAMGQTEPQFLSDPMSDRKKKFSPTLNYDYWTLDFGWTLTLVRKTISHCELWTTPKILATCLSDNSFIYLLFTLKFPLSCPLSLFNRGFPFKIFSVRILSSSTFFSASSLTLSLALSFLIFCSSAINSAASSSSSDESSSSYQK